MPTTIQQLNTSGRTAFTAALGHLFEHSPWVAEETWARRLGPPGRSEAGSFRDAAHLHAELCATLRAAPRERQLALIRAHPDLAGRLACPEPIAGARQNKLTAASAREQSDAGLDHLSDRELAEFTRHNEAYRAKFGFPFVICARLNAKDAIARAMQARLRNPPDTEFNTALAEIEKIAWLRLQDAVSRD